MDRCTSAAHVVLFCIELNVFLIFDTYAKVVFVNFQ